jgi:hypothetical protein
VPRNTSPSRAARRPDTACMASFGVLNAFHDRHFGGTDLAATVWLKP